MHKMFMKTANHIVLRAVRPSERAVGSSSVAESMAE